MATPQQLATSAENLMNQLKNNSISFSQFMNSMQPIKTDYDNQKVLFGSDENDGYSYTISKAIAVSQGEDPTN